MKKVNIESLVKGTVLIAVVIRTGVSAYEAIKCWLILKELKKGLRKDQYREEQLREIDRLMEEEDERHETEMAKIFEEHEKWLEEHEKEKAKDDEALEILRKRVQVIREKRKELEKELGLEDEEESIESEL